MGLANPNLWWDCVGSLEWVKEHHDFGGRLGGYQLKCLSYQAMSVSQIWSIYLILFFVDLGEAFWNAWNMSSRFQWLFSV